MTVSKVNVAASLVTKAGIVLTVSVHDAEICSSYV